MSIPNFDTDYCEVFLPPIFPPFEAPPMQRRRHLWMALLVLFAMVGGYIAVLICLKKKQAQIQNTNTVQTTDYKGLERAALTR